mmetsp:Transcript_9343/g.21226  ORF Transcript_9343/g.21226 Transcript_9343/m.21226 type:complete len:347 (+) Transcript_9343:111-1151(+)|eukprot:CAMPEP_0197879330 /NCGR_PEP_ID=MMETSP1439-20131203/7462_1 /TAXON_ID=66791 /ORGANISM="Gonyaulax spinifera, Strain CCMP409" /LENGTH=346 /DNA_ID=CAMNT_0043498825 /DNA_START=83 /DNA_END=1123 /DNA_ORIENTATION=-
MSLSLGQHFVESEYGSHMQLEMRLSTLELVGFYRTPASPGMLGGYAYGYMRGFGRSYLRGDISKEGGEGSTSIKGEWRHDPGPLGKGTFQVRWDSSVQAMRGWWKEDDGPQNDWTWSTADSFKDEIRHLAHSLGVVRYTLLCCWIFFWQTLVQTFLTIFPTDNSNGSKAHLGFNLVYSVTYVSFCLLYVVMIRRPSVFYMAGVALYTCGYITFAAYFSLVLGEDRQDLLPEFYLLGSLFFLVGSVSLVIATAPVQKDDVRSPFSKGAAVFWGCVSFLLGSIGFTVDAGNVITGGDYNQGIGIASYMIFFIGRFYFVWGSTTPECGFFFRQQTVKKRNSDLELQDRS